MKRLGVFATKEEIESMQERVPYMVFGSVEDKSVPGGHRPLLPQSPQQKCHAYALAHGLPEINGYYGCDLETGEFVTC